MSAAQDSTSPVANKSFVRVGVRLALHLVVVLAPLVVASLLWWPGIASVGIFGVLAGALGAITAGLRLGIIVSMLMALAGDLGILVRDSLWLVALLMIVGGVMYGLAAARGLNLAFMQITITAPFLIMQPPALFSDAVPTVNAGYLAAVALVVILAGSWAAIALAALNKGRTRRGPSVPKEMALRHGVVLGVVAAAAAVVSMHWFPEMHWVWVTLTLYVLASPTGVWNRTRFFYRVLGTAGGFLLASAVFYLAPGAWFISLVGLIFIWLALVMMVLSKPYWVFVIFLTSAVVLMASSGSRAYGLADQRLGFTVVGALLAVVATGLANLWFHSSRTPPTTASA